MTTTSLIVELVIIGFQVLIWVGLLTGVFFDYDWIPFSKLKGWVPVISIAMIGVSYTLGLIFDSFIAVLAGSPRFAVRARTMKRLEEMGASFGTVRDTITLKAPDIQKDLQVINNQIRLVRATAINFILITMATLIYLTVRASFSWRIAVFLICLSVCFTLLAMLAWFRSMIVYNFRIISAYETICSLNGEPQATSGDKGQKDKHPRMLEIEALRQLLFEKGIITEEEFVARHKKLDREMKERRGK